MVIAQPDLNAKKQAIFCISVNTIAEQTKRADLTLERQMEIFECIKKIPPGVTLAELSAEFGISRCTIT